jgi:cytochrome c oxidase cbb3-type subunit 1
MRTLAGVVFVVGMLLFIYNVMMTIKKGKAELEAKVEPATATA